MTKIENQTAWTVDSDVDRETHSHEREPRKMNGGQWTRNDVSWQKPPN